MDDETLFMYIMYAACTYEISYMEIWFMLHTPVPSDQAHPSSNGHGRKVPCSGVPPTPRHRCRRATTSGAHHLEKSMSCVR